MIHLHLILMCENVFRGILKWSHEMLIASYCPCCCIFRGLKLISCEVKARLKYSIINFSLLACGTKWKNILGNFHSLPLCARSLESEKEKVFERIFRKLISYLIKNFKYFPLAALPHNKLECERFIHQNYVHVMNILPQQQRLRDFINLLMKNAANNV